MTSNPTPGRPSEVEAAATSDKRHRFDLWAGQGLPRGWASAMGLRDYDGDSVWPIVDNTTSGPINGFPKPEQMLCWCPTSEKQSIVAGLLRAGVDVESLTTDLAAARAEVERLKHIAESATDRLTSNGST